MDIVSRYHFSPGNGRGANGMVTIRNIGPTTSPLRAPKIRYEWDGFGDPNRTRYAPDSDR